MSEELGKEMWRKHHALLDKHSEERSSLLAEASKKWLKEEAELYQECFEKTGHKFAITPERRRKLNGILAERCQYCGRDK